MNFGVSDTNSFIKIENIQIPEIFNRRFKTNIDYLDNAFCQDGWVPGSTFTINGTPGAGKTTILCQLLQQLSLNNKKVAYISGEESVYQLAYNCKRLGVTDVFVSNISDLRKALASIEENKFEFVILDSIPCFQLTGMYYSNRDREQAAVELILSAAHNNSCVIGCVLHVTKAGTYKGTTLLPHAVDANYSLKRDEEDEDVRVLEATKNRFGCAVTTPLRMTQHGFSFEPIIEEEAADAQANERVSILTVRSNKIIGHIKAEGNISMQQAVALCDNNQQNAYLALRNCIVNGLIVKTGRGDDARWSLPV